MTTVKPKKDRSYDQCCNGGCLVTRNDGQKLLSCGGCGLARYCSKACQKEAWKMHKSACKALQVIRKEVASDSIRGEDDLRAYERSNKWILKQRSNLSLAMIASFDIPKNPQIQRRQGLIIHAKYLKDKDDDHCLAITEFERFKLDRLQEVLDHTRDPGASRESLLQQRAAFEETETVIHRETYGVGLMIMKVSIDGEPFFSQGLPIAFDHNVTKSSPRSDAVWQNEVKKRTGSIPW